MDEYAVDGNATRAAIAAGYSERTAQVIGSENLAKPLVAAAIAKNEDERSKRVNFTADDALRKLIPFVNTSIKNFITQDSEGNYQLATLEQIAALDDDVAVQIHDLKEVTKFDQFGNPIREVSYKLHDPVKAITQAGKHRAVRAWTEQVEHTHSLADHMRRIRGEEA